MKLEYEKWISKFFLNNNWDVQGMCCEAAHSMGKAFPELKVVRGHVVVWDKYDEQNYKYPHWWLVTDKGEIVDPTESQFPNIVNYELWDESMAEPTGKCPNCGEYCFDHKYFCSEGCEKSYMAYINTGVL